MHVLTGRYAMIEQLLAEGVEYVFGNPGTTEQAFMDALQDYPQLKYVLALQESIAIGMADGYSRVSGRPAFVQLHIMPGLGNAMGMLYNSYRTRTPMVIYAGQHPQRGASQEPILAGDLVRLAEPLTKWAVEAQDANEVPLLVRRAFKVAMEPPRGPVFVAVPANVMDEECSQAIVASTPVDTQVRPAPAAIARVAALLLEAQAPVIICGDGVATSGAQAELVQLAEMVGARVHASFSPELPFPSAHPLYAGLLNVVSAAGLRGSWRRRTSSWLSARPCCRCSFRWTSRHFRRPRASFILISRVGRSGRTGRWRWGCSRTREPRSSICWSC